MNKLNLYKRKGEVKITEILHFLDFLFANTEVYNWILIANFYFTHYWNNIFCAKFEKNNKNINNFSLNLNVNTECKFMIILTFQIPRSRIPKFLLPYHNNVIILTDLSSLVLIRNILKYYHQFCQNLTSIFCNMYSKINHK